MPLYSCKCTSCGKVDDVFIKLANIEHDPVCKCGGRMKRQLSAPAVRGDYPAYHCPVTGKLIDGRRQHEENLAQHGCRVLETGEVEQARRAKQQEEQQFDKMIENTTDEFLSNLSSDKMENLVREVKSGVAPTVERQ